MSSLGPSDAASAADEQVTAASVDGVSARPPGVEAEAEDDSSSATVPRSLSHELLLNYHVKLDPAPVRFPGKFGTVYFDQCNMQLVITKNKEVKRIPIRKEHDDVKISAITLAFVVEAKCTKFSLDHHYLAIQQTQTQVQFINLQNHTMFTHICKRPKSPVLGFFWTSFDNVFFITNTGLELYQYSKSRNLKLIKEHRLNVNWFVYSSKLRLLLLASGTTNNQMNGFYFKQNTIVKIPKFEVNSTAKQIVQQRDISIHQIYDRVYCIYSNCERMELSLYHMTRETVTKSASVNLHTNGAVAIHVVDNILVAHNLDHKITLLFDIREPDHFVAAPLPLAPWSSSEPDAPQIESYFPGWKFYAPNFVLDTEHGYLWQLRVDLEAIAMTFPDRVRLIDFLLRRSGSKQLLLRVLKMVIEEGASVSTLAKIFDKLNIILKSVPDDADTKDPSSRTLKGSSSVSTLMAPAGGGGGSGSSNSAASSVGAGFSSGPNTPVLEEFGNEQLEEAISASSPIRPRSLPASATVDKRTPQGFVVISQADVYTHVFLKLEEEQHMVDYQYFVAFAIEYIRSLNFHHIPVQHFMYELVINALVRNRRFYQLHQFLQYHVVSDSIPVACQLLSLEQTYPPAQQLALDMLKRLNSSARIVEVLLSRKQLLTALRVIRTNKDLTQLPVARFLDTAASMNDDVLFYTVFKFFEQRGEIREDCAEYIKLYQAKFLQPEVSSSWAAWQQQQVQLQQQQLQQQQPPLSGQMAAQRVDEPVPARASAANDRPGTPVVRE